MIGAEIAATYAGFAAVCRNGMGLEPEVVLRAHLDPLPIVQELDELDARPDPGAVGYWTDSFEDAWRAHLDR